MKKVQDNFELIDVICVFITTTPQEEDKQKRGNRRSKKEQRHITQVKMGI